MGVRRLCHNLQPSELVGGRLVVLRTKGALAATTMTNDWNMAVTRTLATISNEFMRFINRLIDRNPSMDITSFFAVRFSIHAKATPSNTPMNTEPNTGPKFP